MGVKRDVPRLPEEEIAIMTEQHYLPLTRAAIMLNVDRKRVRQLIARGELAAFDDPLDRRCVLVRREDLARLRQPRPRAQAQQVSALV
jgi:hypothetical protein